MARMNPPLQHPRPAGPGPRHDPPAMSRRPRPGPRPWSQGTRQRTGRASRPRLSVIVLTLNEEANVVDAVESLLAQRDVDLEVLVVDSASQDRTVPLVQELAKSDPRVRLVASPTHLSIGKARNHGLEATDAPLVAFMSADATAAPGWARAIADALEEADVVYGRQEHTPPRPSVAAAVRGMRYHHFRDDAHRDPETYASNVNAAVRRIVFDRVHYVDDGPASALDDILFTKQAKMLGYQITYRRDMLVRHKDAVSMREELIKNRREGHGWGLLAPRLGMHWTVLAWGALLLAAIATAGITLHPAAWTLSALILWAPTLRRAVHSLHLARRPAGWLGAILVSPAFDLAFLVAYLGGLRHRRNDLSGVIPFQGA